LTEQTIDAATANANHRNGLASHRSDCSEAAQPMRAEVEVISVVSYLSWFIFRLGHAQLRGPLYRQAAPAGPKIATFGLSGSRINLKRRHQA
jgi:hypothetical protein